MRRAQRSENVESTVRQMLGEALEQKGYHVTVEPVIGPVKPDFLVDDGRGHAVVIEVKAAPGGSHFGAVAQTAAFRDAAAADRSAKVGAMLVVAGDEAHELDASGADYGVQIVGTASVEPAKVVGAVIDRLSGELWASAEVS